jgi:hypothetical protein
MAQVPRGTHKTYVNTNIVDNTTNDITGAEVNKSIIDLHDSCVWFDELPSMPDQDWRQVTAENIDVTATFPTFQKVSELSLPATGAQVFELEADVIFDAGAVTATDQLIYFKIEVENPDATIKEYIFAESHHGIAKNSMFRTYAFPVAMSGSGTAKFIFHAAIEIGEQDVTVKEIHLSSERKK